MNYRSGTLTNLTSKSIGGTRIEQAGMDCKPPSADWTCEEVIWSRGSRRLLIGI